jgi:lipopolysaccharide biosynthesis glycosyltransferase
MSNLSLEASIYYNQGFWVKNLRKWERKRVREKSEKMSRNELVDVLKRCLSRHKNDMFEHVYVK